MYKTFQNFVFQEDIRKVIAIVLLYKFAFLTIVFFGYHLLPFSSGSFYANLHYPSTEHISFLTTFQTWDGQHYHLIAKEGYNKNSMSSAFYPLYPTLISIFSYVTSLSNVVTAILLSNLLSFGAVILLFLLSKEFMDSERAILVIILFLTYPVAFYTNVMYSESLFLILIFGFFYAVYKENIFFASILAVLLPLSRPQGHLVIAVFFIF